jgi:hypothetical protein
MAIAEDLAHIGFAPSGSPPTIVIEIGKASVRMRVTEVAEVKGGVHLRGELPVTVPPSLPDLSGATISASGDTTLALAGSALIGTRRLVAPSSGAMYDAIYELAKTLIAAGRLLHDRAESEANAPPATEPVDAVASVPYPAPPAAAPAPAPAPAPPPAVTPGSVVTAPLPGAVATAAIPAPVPGSFLPTHTVPVGGLPAWAAPDATQAPAATLDAGLPVQLAEQQGGWARIICENTWSAWVDLSKLIPR